MTDSIAFRWEAYSEAGKRCFAEKQYEKAEEAFLAALRAAEQFGDDDPRLATSLNSLARVYGRREKFFPAAALLHRLLGIKERALGEQHPELAGVLTNLAEMYTRLGDVRQELQMRERALALRHHGGGEKADALITPLQARVAELKRRLAEEEAAAARTTAVEAPVAPIVRAVTPEHVEPRSAPKDVRSAASHSAPLAPPLPAALASVPVPPPAPSLPAALAADAAPAPLPRRRHLPGRPSLRSVRSALSAVRLPRVPRKALAAAVATGGVIGLGLLGRSMRGGETAHAEAVGHSSVDTAAGTLERETIVVGPTDINTAMAAHAARGTAAGGSVTPPPGVVAGDGVIRRAAEGKKSEERHGDIVHPAQHEAPAKETRVAPPLVRLPSVRAPLGLERAVRTIEVSARTHVDSLVRAASVGKAVFKRPRKLTLTQF